MDTHIFMQCLFVSINTVKSHYLFQILISGLLDVHLEVRTWHPRSVLNLLSLTLVLPIVAVAVNVFYQ